MRQSGITSTQYTQKMMDMTVRETLTVLFDYLIEGLARYGCGVTGMPYYDDADKNTLP
jgi:hypothetical protein